MSTFQQGPEGLSMTRRSTNIDQEIGQQIKKRRQKAGMSQSLLAQAIGVTFQQVQKYESGKNRISVSMMIEIAKVLQCSVQEILDANEPSVLNKTEYSILNCWRNLPSDKHREVIHTLLGWL
ncbi:MAG: helix-turn-helix domain-containing protein [Alphaproteobacteria bacterium]|nr:helix-turn-helix domain-containing protein [Alphaproteobacteria bacterium]